MDSVRTVLLFAILWDSGVHLVPNGASVVECMVAVSAMVVFGGSAWWQRVGNVAVVLSSENSVGATFTQEPVVYSDGDSRSC